MKAFLLVSSLSLLVLSAQAQLSFRQFSNPSGIFPNQEQLVPAQSSVLSLFPPLSDGPTQRTFTHWTLNGIEQRGPSGQALYRLGFTIQSDTDAIANYLSTSDDTNNGGTGNGVPDWQEFRFYGGFVSGPGHDEDADTFSHVAELDRGYPPTLPDTMDIGGISIRHSAPLVRRDDSVHMRVTIRSQPQDLVPSAEHFVSSGSTFDTPDFSLVSDYHSFTHWTVNGMRYPNASAPAHTQLRLTITEDSTLIAHFSLTAADEDMDGIQDWKELRFFGNLAGDLQSDQDLDALGFGEEEARGYAPYLHDEIATGGVSIRYAPGQFYRSPAYRYYERASEPPGLIPSDQAYLVAGSEVPDPSSFSLVNGSNTFTHWTVNGVAQRHANGQALQNLDWVLDEDAVIRAHYLPTNQNTDGDGILDWVELRHFPDLGSADDATDVYSTGITVLEELERGYPLATKDEFTTGGVSIRFAPGQVYRSAAYRYFERRSSPAGLMPADSGYVLAGTVLTDPSGFSLVSGSHMFTHWEVNGVPQRHANGQALLNLDLGLSDDALILANYLPNSVDSDSDTIPDWIELRYFSDLAGVDTASDPFFTSLTLGEELARDYPMAVHDQIAKGGLSIRYKSSLRRRPSFRPIRDVLIDSYLTRFFGLNPGQTGTFDCMEQTFPALGDWDGDGDYELGVACSGDPIRFFENAGSSFTANWVPRPGTLTNVPISDASTTIELGDWTGDGKEDLAVSGSDGLVRLYISDGSFSSAGRMPDLTLDLTSLSYGVNSPIWTGQRLHLAVSDLDADGLKDLICCSPSGEMVVFWNTGTSPWFSDAAPGFTDFQFNPTVAGDISGISGHKDSGIVFITVGGLISGYEYVAGAQPPLAVGAGLSPFGGTFPGYSSSLAPSVADVDGDGDQDIVTGFEEGGLLLLQDPRLAPPFTLVAYDGATGIRVEWTPNREFSLDGYFLYRTTDPAAGPWRLIAEIPPGTRTYRDLDPILQPGADYHYRLTAITKIQTPYSTAPVIYQSPPSESNAAQIQKAGLFLTDLQPESGGTFVTRISTHFGDDIDGASLHLDLAFDSTALAVSSVTKTAATHDLVFTWSVDTDLGILSIHGTGGRARGNGKLFDVRFSQIPAPAPAPREQSAPSIQSGGVGLPDGLLTLQPVQIRNLAGAQLTAQDFQNEYFQTEFHFIYNAGDVNLSSGPPDGTDLLALLALMIEQNQGLHVNAASVIKGDLNGDGVLGVADIPLMLALVNDTANPVTPSLSNGSYQVSTSEIIGSAGSSIEVPIQIDNAEGISACYMQLNFDPNYLEFDQAFATSGSLGEHFQLNTFVSNGVLYTLLHRTGASAPGAGELFRVRFNVNPGALPGRDPAEMVIADVAVADPAGSREWWQSNVVQSTSNFWVTPTPTADADGDGTPDIEEQYFNGSYDYDPFDPVNNPFGTDLSTSTLDSDLDGFMDRWELTRGTNPFLQNPKWIDSDGDGIFDIIEYALNLNPFARDGTRANGIQLGIHPDSRRPTLSFHRLKHDPRIQYICEWSENLSQWFTEPTLSEMTHPIGDGTLYDEVTASDDPVSSIGTGQKFYRLRIIVGD